MTSKRLYFLLSGVIVLLLAGIVGGVYSVNSMLTDKADKLVELKAKSQALAEEQQSLVQAKKDLAKYADLEKIAKSVVPQDKDQAQAVRQIVKMADSHHVTLSSISFPSSSLGSTPGGSSAAASSTVMTPVTSSTGKLSQLQPLKAIPGVYELPITITSDTNHKVSYGNFISFLKDLEHNRRTAQVSSITITPDPKQREYLSFSLTVSEYIKP